MSGHPQSWVIAFLFFYAEEKFTYNYDDHNMCFTYACKIYGLGLAGYIKDVSLQVGYSVRFDEKACNQTMIKYLTDGMLVQEALKDPDLTRYKVRCPDGNKP